MRQYEEALQQALSGGGGGSYSAAPDTAAADWQAEPMVTPVIPQTQGSGPLAATAPAIPLSEWETMQQGMENLYQSSVEKKNQDTAALKSTAAMTGIPNGTLSVAALNAAQNGTVRNAVNAANQKKKKQ